MKYIGKITRYIELGWRDEQFEEIVIYALEGNDNVIALGRCFVHEPM